MNPSDQEKLGQLCTAVIREKDTRKLCKLVQELNELLARRERKSSGFAQTTPIASAS